MKSEEIKFDGEKRKDILDYALEVVQDAFYTELMANLSKLEYPDRNRNFYNGYTKIQYPYFTDIFIEDTGLHYKIHTSASSGKISTKDFAKTFDIDKIETDLHVTIKVYTPNSDAQITFNIEKITMKEFRNHDILGFTCYLEDPSCAFDADLTNISETRYEDTVIRAWRHITQEEIKNMRILDKMPGFMITWNSSENKNVPKFIDYSWTKQFVRYFLILLITLEAYLSK